MFKAIIAAATIGLMASQAGAQQRPQCGPHDKVVYLLSKRFGEVSQMAGLDRKGMVLQIFANPETGTWTAVLTNAAGTACLVSSGEAFKPIQPEPAGTDG